jgi:DNA-binding transcriptional LysR family regulator
MDKALDFQLSVFKSVIETGSMAAAAAALAISRSSVSRHVQNLEAAYKEILLDRTSGRRATATPAGSHVFKYASLLDELEKLAGGDEAVNLKAESQRSVIPIGAHDFIAEKFLPSIIAKFKTQRPDTDIDLRRGRTSEIVKLVRGGEIDLGFVLAAIDEKIDGLNSESVSHERLGIFAVPSHPLANRVDVSLADASGYAFVTPGGGKMVDDTRILSLLSRMGLTDVRSAPAPSSVVTWYGLVAGSPNLCLAIHSRVEAELARGELVEIDVDAAPIFFDVQMIWRDEWKLLPASRAFLTFSRSQEHRAFLSD